MLIKKKLTVPKLKVFDKCEFNVYQDEFLCNFSSSYVDFFIIPVTTDIRVLPFFIFIWMCFILLTQNTEA